MKRLSLPLVVGAILYSTISFGQSVITLESVDASGTDKASAMEKCLFLAKGAECKDAEYGGSTEITLDDVVNLGVVDRQDVSPRMTSRVEAAAPLPSIDLEIGFAYDSASLTSGAYTKLSDLVRLMNDPRMQNQRLVFIGHTDGVGSQAYNLELSQRRANTVAQYVRAITGMPGNRVSAVGVGFSHLKNRFDPTAAENRRVQLVLVPIS